MTEHLFSGQSVFTVKDQAVGQAHKEVLAFPDSVFKDRALLTNYIDQIRHRLLIDVPTISFDQRKGKRRRDGNRDVIDVTIPFDGDQGAFWISPSRSTLGAKALVNPKTIVITLPDNERLESELEASVATISNNLKALANDLSTLEKEINDAIEHAVNRRTAEVKRKSDLDSGRSFPIE